MSGSSWESLPDVREWWGRLHACSGVVGTHSRMFGSSREALPDVREWSVGHPGCTTMVGRPSGIC